MQHTNNKIKLKELIRKFVREMNVTSNVQGYESPNAFKKRGDTKQSAKQQADLTGYSVVDESKELDKETLLKIYNLPKGAKNATVKKEKHGYTIKYNNPKTGGTHTSFLSQSRIDNYLSGKLKESISENRWLELKNEEMPANAKIGKGISNINKQLAEMEKFLNWYGKLKQESGVTNDQFWKRTNGNILKIKERLIKVENQIRKISE